MNAFLSCIYGFALGGGGLLEGVLGWVWSTSLAVVPLVALVLMFEHFGRRFLPVRGIYWLWLMVAARLLLPAVPASRLSILNLASIRSQGVAASARLSPRAVPANGGEASLRPASLLTVESSPAPASARVELASARMSSVLAEAIPWLWLAGAAGYLLVVLNGQRRLGQRVRSRPVVTEAPTLAVLEEAKSLLGIRRKVRLIEMELAPSLFGFFRPCLLMPRGLAGQLEAGELRLVFLHELIHLQRRDVLQNWVLIFLQALHWFNPLVWLAFRHLRAARELDCDAAVLSRLDTEQRRTYGAALIKIFELFSGARRVPGLLPILNRKSEIHRRIVMITKFKRVTLLSIAGTMVVAVIVGVLTFTAAAQKEPVRPAEAPTANAPMRPAQATAERGLKVLQEEIGRRDQEIEGLQKRLEAWQRALQIADTAEAEVGQRGAGLETLRQAEGLRLDALNEFIRAEVLYTNFSNMPLAEMKRIVLTVQPDALLTDLLTRQSVAEEKLAELQEEFGAGHPDVKRTRAGADRLGRQINERLRGMVEGFKAKREAAKARLDTMQEEVERMRKTAMDRAIERRPYLQAKRELENLESMREKLQMRFLQEQIDEAIPR